MSFSAAMTAEEVDTPRPGSDRGRSAWRPPWSAMSRELVAGICVLAAIGGAFAGSTPTGTGWWDPVLAASLAALVTACASLAPRALTIIVTTVAALLVGVTVWLAAAAGALLVAVGAALLPRRDRVVGAVAGALAVQALLRLPPLLFFGFPSLVVGVAAVWLVAGAYGNARRATRRRMRIAAIVAIVLAGLLAVLASVLLVSVRQGATQGIAAARRGLEAARAGDTTELVAELDVAEQRLRSTAVSLDGLLAQPLKLVPIAAQNRQALVGAAVVGANTAESAVAAEFGDLATFRLNQGAVDLERLRGLAPALRSTVVTIDDASAALAADRSPWVLPPLQDRLTSLSDQIDALRPEAELAAEAAEVLPGLLGADGIRHYLVLSATPGETRELGGFVGGYSLLAFEGGSVTAVASGRVTDLYDIARAGALDDPAGYPTRFIQADPQQWPQNLTSSPSVHLVARATRDLIPALNGRAIDGIIYVDAFAVAELLNFTGPISVEGVDGFLTAATFAEFALIEQYRTDGRDDLVGNLATSAFGSLATSDLPGPEELGRVLGPVARQGRLQVVTFDDAENAFLERVRLQRTFGWSGESDAIAVVQTNASENKLDLYLHRRVEYDVRIADDGRLDAVVNVDLTLDVPADAPSYTLGRIENDGGINDVLMSVYSPHTVTSYTVDGVETPVASEEEFGFLRHFGLPVPISAGQTVRLQYVLQGRAPAGDYSLLMWYQPTVNNDQVAVTIYDVAGNPISSEIDLVEDTQFVLPN